MSDYTPAEHAHCHVCGHWTRLTDRRLMYRHRYGGASGSDYCVGGRHRVGEIIPGFAGPYVRDPRPHDPQDNVPDWSQDYARGYRAHLPHPYSVNQGDSGCFICGGPQDRHMHDQPWRRITWAEFKAEQAEKAKATEPPPVFTDTSFEARQARLKAPAVSNPSPGGIGKVVQRYPNSAEDDAPHFGALIDQVFGRKSDREHPNEEEPMHLNIHTTEGTVKKVRAYVTTEDGTQGAFAEADDHATAIAQVAGAALSGATVGVFTGSSEVAKDETPKAGLVFRASAAAAAPDYPRASRRVVTSTGAIKALVREAMEDDKHVIIHWRDGHALSPSRQTVYPLYETTDHRGFVGRDSGHRARTYNWRDITRAEEARRADRG